MKVFLRIAAVSLGLLFLSACASTKTAYENAPRQPESLVTDQAYVAVVEEYAKRRGTRVMWVNPPQKRVVQVVASSQ